MPPKKSYHISNSQTWIELNFGIASPTPTNSLMWVGVVVFLAQILQLIHVDPISETWCFQWQKPKQNSKHVFEMRKSASLWEFEVGRKHASVPRMPTQWLKRDARHEKSCFRSWISSFRKIGRKDFWCFTFENPPPYQCSNHPIYSRLPFKNASWTFTPKHATSPVLDISTPRRGSEFFRRPKENIGHLHAT